MSNIRCLNLTQSSGEIRRVVELFTDRLKGEPNIIFFRC